MSEAASSTRKKTDELRDSPLHKESIEELVDIYAIKAMSPIQESENKHRMQTGKNTIFTSFRNNKT